MATRTNRSKRPPKGVWLFSEVVAARDEWVRVVNELAEEISAWVREEPGWEVSTATNEIPDTSDAYTVPTLTIQTPEGRLILEPSHYTLSRKASNHLGGGVVEFYAWPTLFRVRLLYGQPQVKWQVMTESRVPLRQEWNRANFIQLAKDLVGAEL